MAGPLRPISEKTLMANVGITEEDIERRKKAAGLVADDYKRIRSIAPIIEAHVEELTNSFFQYLGGIEGAKVLLAYRELTTEAKQLKRDHLRALVQAKYDMAYVEQRIRLGMLYGRVGLDMKIFLGAFQHLLASIGRTIMRERNDADTFECFLSLQRATFFDIGVQVDVLTHERDRTINVQSQAIRELSTPVLQIRERLLLLPLIGVIDSHRAKLVTQSLLDAVRAKRAKVVVMDVTGVATIDSGVANHLVQTVTAAKLMGARVIVTGVSAEVAQSMVALGVEVTPFYTVGDLQGGVEDAERILGYRVVAAASEEH